jgi:nucleotide-binding universal stress UspA family protein
VKLECQVIQARQSGHAIVDEAVETGADAIALGLPFERPFGKFQLNEASEYILEHAPCEVWLFRYAPANPPREGVTS